MSKKEIEYLMSVQSAGLDSKTDTDIINYCRTMALIENALVVVSDMVGKTSRIFPGGFADRLGLEACQHENSIWETTILSHLPESELDVKIISELKFYHYIKNRPKSKRDYYLLTKLRFTGCNGEIIKTAHRMFYVYERDSQRIRYAVCIYAPLTFDFKGRSVIVNSITGVHEELTSTYVPNILSNRERQVLSMIAEGRKSAEIAELLNLSIHTVSRHRQEILSKLQVKNSIDACCMGRSLELI
ncbi:MAG: helix-turn-helix transcriptional regulator [Muribaculaceae bacterium]|nr:helix-turn-helix transcriptional regulator [Muribaculaceae bacterium]